MWDHFVKTEDNERLERDSKQLPFIAPNSSFSQRMINYRFMPQIVKNEENLKKVGEYMLA